MEACTRDEKNLRPTTYITLDPSNENNIRSQIDLNVMLMLLSLPLIIRLVLVCAFAILMDVLFWKKPLALPYYGR